MYFRYAAILLCLSACVGAADEQHKTMPVQQALVDQAKAKVGKKFWASNSQIELCENLAQVSCPRPPGKLTDEYGPFLIKNAVFMDPAGIEMALTIQKPDGEFAYLKTYFQNDFVSDAVHHQRIKEHAQAKADCSQRGGIHIGMTEHEVLASCWGKPKQKNTTVTSGGNHEQWVYGGGYVYIDDGVVTGIQTSR